MITSVKELRDLYDMSRAEFSTYFNIPRRNIENWEQEVNVCSEYLLVLMEYKLENKDNCLKTVIASVKELRGLTDMTQQAFGEYFGIPRRTIQDWECNKMECKKYLLSLMEYKLRKEEVIK